MSYRLIVVTLENELLCALPQQLEGVEVQLMDSANAALWEVQSNPPEALLAEVDLPDMSGLDLAEILPNFGVPTRVLLWSGAPNEAARKQAEAAGVYRFFEGDTTADTLYTALRAAMDEAHHAPRPEPEPEPDPEPPPPPRAERPAFTPARVTLPSAEERAAEAKKEKPPITPARVTLPSAGERAAGSSSSSSKGGLGSRAKAAAEKAERAEKEKPAPPPAAPLGQRRHSGTLIVTAENINPIRMVMSQLGQDLGAASTILADRAGLVLVEVGTTDNLPMFILLPLLSTSFSTAGEIARQLHDEDATTLYIHEGVSIDLYCFDVVQRFLLVLVFNKKVASSKIGAVWVNAKRAIRELRELLVNT